MAYTLLTKTQISYDAINLSNLAVISAASISEGSNVLGSGSTLLVADIGVQLRNRVGRTVLAFQNTHASLSGYARIVTTRSYYGLALDDIDLVLPSDGRIQIIGGFTNIFHANSSETTTLVPGTDVTRNYSDYIQIMLAHDSSNPVGAIKIGAYYL